MSSNSVSNNTTISRSIINTLSIAGVDPSGGAGILADVKAMSALGTYACAVVAALTAQNTQAVTRVLPVSPEFVAQQIDTLFQDVVISSVKIGMLGQTPVIDVVTDRLSHWRPSNIVLDPVMVAKSGDHLLEKKAIGALREQLIPLSTMITPNLPEAAVLLEKSTPETVRQMYPLAEQLRNLMPLSDERWVFLKGGHLPGDLATDLLFNGDKMIEMPAYKTQTKNTHGTGCTLSAALAALIPQSTSVPIAAQRAKEYLGAAISRSDELQVGQGHGPVHHFHPWW